MNNRHNLLMENRLGAQRSFAWWRLTAALLRNSRGDTVGIRGHDRISAIEGGRSGSCPRCSRTDHGTVVCLDPRVVTKSYGRLFLESLPECRRIETTATMALPQPPMS